MLKHYLKIAARNLNRTKAFSFVNILGLAIGMSACLLILHYVSFEKSYDTYHENSDRIYRLRYERTDQTSGQSVRFASCCPPAAARIRGNYPEVEQIARLLKTSATVSYENTKFLEERVFYAEPDIFGVLKFDFIKGDPATGISEPNNAFVSSSTASRYFGDEDPVGKTFSTNQRTEYQVAGVFGDLPQNTHLKVDILLPWKNLEAAYGPEYYEAWGHTGSYTYLMASPGTEPRAFETKLLGLVATECPWLVEYNMTIDLVMQPLEDIHLNSHFMQEYEANGSRESVDLLFIIAFFIMIMAWVNYVNLSTAGAIHRAREVGLRKVVGASKGQLVVQFFFEIIVTNAVAIICAVGLVLLSLPYFSGLTGVPGDYAMWSQNWFWIALGGMFVAGVFLSGLYPVLAMSSFKPAVVLKGRLASSARGILLRKTLVVFQFVVGVVLVIATFTVHQQISFMRSQELGFDMDQTLVIRAPRVRGEAYGSDVETFKQTLLGQTGIEQVCHVTEVPGRQIYWDAGGIRRAGTDISEGKNYQIVGIDYDFAELFGLEFVAGRNISREFSTDSSALLLNETAVRHLGFESAADAIGQKVDYWEEIMTVVGVMKDYHQQSLKEEFEPHIFRYMPYGRGSMGAIALKIDGSNVRETVATVRTHYDQLFPGNPFDYFFLDDYFNQQYESDELFGKVYGLFSLLAIVVIALGIYGLSSFAIVQRTKEIGIRKVLGASVASVMGLLTREFVILVAVANVIAWPVAYYFMDRWLASFANRTDLGLVTFVVAGFSTLAIALLTVSYQVTKAAHANPVDAIAHE